MLTALLFVVLIALNTILSAQILTLPDTAGFYDYLEAFYTSPGYSPADTSEGGSKAQHNRLGTIWAPRLHPHGDFSIANKAIIDYAQNYAPVRDAGINPNWTCLGPSNTPSATNWKGVGQIHRITFDPGYDGVNNLTIYACSSFGGLWRTEDDGANWAIVNTDALPISSVADVAINPDNANTIFIGTGLADNGITLSYSPNWANTNPIYTIGIFRSFDYGATWHTINTGFIDYFNDHGGTIRKLTIDKLNPQVLFAATSNGIFRTENALETMPLWTKVYEGETEYDGDFRSIEFKPGSSDVLYASSLDIFKSTDGGDTWDPITGTNTGLDFVAMEPFYPERINLAVTPADPERIYAYIHGDDVNLPNSGGYDYKSVYIYNFENGLWSEYVFKHGYNAKEWMALAVSPVDPDVFFAYGAFNTGTIGVYGTTPYPAHPWLNYSVGSQNAYPDGHVLAFQPNVSNKPGLFYGSHGGISFFYRENFTYYPWPTYDLWEYRNNGLQNQLFWAFDHSKFKSGVFMTANQDCGHYLLKDNSWNIIPSSGDGYTARASYNNIDLFLRSSGSASLGSFNLSTSNQYGEVNKIPYDGEDPTVKTVIPKTFPLMGFPNSAYDFIGFCELYKRNFDWPDGHTTEELWEIDSDIGKFVEGRSDRQITEADFCQANPDVIYIATGGVFSENENGCHLVPGLYKTTIGGNNGIYSDDAYAQLGYPGINDVDYPVISGIAVHPTDPDSVWISMIGYDNISIRVAYSSNGGLSWENADPNNSLPELPINNILYQYGSNDGLYIATDVGVYYKDADMPNWVEYGDFPHVRVNEMSINYCTQKIAAATFGRALWEGDLMPAENPVCYEIEDGETLVWDKPKALQTGVRVKSGGELLVLDLVNMPVGGKIIVEPGGKLTIDGGKISNTCGKYWQGIELRGTSTAPQDPMYQGLVIVKNGGTIENAVTGILVGNTNNPGCSGGIVEATNAVFHNNHTSVEIKPYNIFTESIFSNCEFTTDDGWPHEISPPYNYAAPVTFVKLEETNGHRFEGCTFKNLNPEIFIMKRRGYGIQGINSEFSVDQMETTSQPSVFENLYYGINAIAYTSEKAMEIRNSGFTNNYNGVYVGAVGNAWITSNNFTVPESLGELNSSYGLYLDECTGYHVEDNHFTSTVSDINTGLYVNNSGTDDNTIYNNVFDQLYAASVFQDINRYNIIGGLCVRCNDYTNNVTDVSVVVSENCVETPDHGIAKNQGSMEPANDAPAGNTFSEFADHAWDIYNETNSIVYVYHNEDFTPNINLYPDQNFGDVTTHENIYANYSKAESCPSTLEGGGLKSAMLEASAKADSTATVLSSIVDGGNTGELDFDVQMAMPGQALETRDMLLADSPNLSDTVMVSAIEIENVLPNAMVRDVLVENPQAAKSDIVQDALDVRANSLPQYMRNEIDQGADTLSEKEISEAALAFFRHEKATSFNRLHFSYRADTLIVGADSIAQLYNDNATLHDQYRLALLRFEQNDTIASDSILDAVQYNFSLCGEQETERQNYVSFVNMMKQMKNNGASQPDSTLIAGLLNLMQNGNGMPPVYARSVLIASGEITYVEPLLLPDTTLKMAVAGGVFAIDIEKNDERSRLMLQPNPANNYFVVSWHLAENTNDAVIDISSSNGLPISTVELKSRQNELVVPTANWQPGIYIVSLVDRGVLLESKKISIVK